MVWYSHLLKNFPQFGLIHTVKGFGIVNKAEIDVFLELSCMLAIWSLVPLPFLNPAWTSGSSWFTYCWSLACRIFEHYFASVWDVCNCAVVWAFFGIAFLWDWNENWPFPVLWPLLSFPNFEPVHCPLSCSNCCFLTCIQVSHEAGKVVWYSHLFQNFQKKISVCCDPHSQRL